MMGCCSFNQHWRLATLAFICLAGSTGIAEAGTGTSPSYVANHQPGGPETKVWVFFEDGKGYTDRATRAAAVARLSADYHPRALVRRAMRRTAPGLFDERDLPVAKVHVDGIQATGAQVHVVSRWLNAVSAMVTDNQMEQIAALAFVKSIRPVRRGKYELPAESTAPAASAARGSFYGQAEEQLSQIDLLEVHGQGYTGAGVVVGVLDTGFQRSHEAFNEPGHPINVVAEYDFLNNDANTAIEIGDDSEQHRHGTWILGTIGGYKPGVYVGGAYDASFILAKTEDVTNEYPAEEDYYVAGLEFVESNGGDMMTASLGYIDWYSQSDLDGVTAVTTIAVNIASINGIHICSAAGNSGHDASPGTSALIAPSDAFQAITCGAVDNTDAIASFSSDGPTADGRVKPEVLARGVNTRTVSSANDANYSGVGGTSLSTPLVAAAVACLVQAHPDWTVDQMRRYLMFTADDYVANQAYDATFVRGYGIINVAAALAADCNGNSVDDGVDLSSNTSSDCNANLFPDECDITQGFSADLDKNGIPDECDCVPTLFGDIAPLGGDGIVELGDVLCMLAGYDEAQSCPGGDIAPCDGDGVIELADLLNLLAAYANNPPCADPCTIR